MNVRDFTRVRVRAVVLCVFALCALTVVVPASAVAAGHHDAGAHKARAKGKGKKKPKKKSTTVIVKCASVTVTCKGTPGPSGPQGSAGTNGTNGSAVVLRARGAGPAGTEKVPPGCMSFICIEGGNVPISPSTWTEAPNEDDQMIGTLTLTLPGSKECGDENSKKEFEDAGVFAIASVGNAIEGILEAKGSTTPRTVTTSLVGPTFFRIELEDEELEKGELGEFGELGTGFFIGDASSHTRTITLKAIDNCLSTHVTVSNAAIDVLASY